MPHLERMDIPQTLRFILGNTGWLGREIVEKALTLINVLTDTRTPLWAYPVIVGALAYLVMPFDACPDFVPLAGLADDTAALVTAFATVTGIIRPEHTEKARSTTNSIFGT